MRPNMRPMEKTDLKGALNDLSTYMRKSLGVVVLALVLAALSAVLTIIGPDQVGKIATIMSEGLLGGIDLAAIARVWSIWCMLLLPLSTVPTRRFRTVRMIKLIIRFPFMQPPRNLMS